MSKKIIEPTKIETIIVTTDGSGNASVKSANIINGEILKVAYDKGTVTTATTSVLTNYTALTGPEVEAIDSYTVNSGSAMRYARAEVTGSSAGDNNWCPFVVNDYLLVTVSGGQHNVSFTVYVFYR